MPYDEALDEAIRDAEPQCANCGHGKGGHQERFGGICIGCPCPGWKPTETPGVETD